jgi:hypothetical protein
MVPCCGKGKDNILKEHKMKKIADKIAMILILVMLAGTFTSCFTAWCIENASSGAILLLPVALGFDLITLPFQIADLARGKRWRQASGVYTVEGAAPLTEEERALLTEKTASLPEEDGAFLMALIAALPETERASAMEKINSVPEQKFPSTVKAMRTLYVLPQADRVSLVEAIRSLPEKEQLFLTETANSLTDGEISALVAEINSIPTVELSRQIKVLRETTPSEWGYREYVAERFVTR